MTTPYARETKMLWLGAGAVAIGYGVFLVVTALRLPADSILTGRFPGQPLVKALPCLLLAVAALWHPFVRERRWLAVSLVFSAGGDLFLAMPWWTPSFVLGLGSFLFAHMCYVGTLLPLCGRRAAGPLAGTNPGIIRKAGAAVMVVLCLSLYLWFWPHLVAEGLTIPVLVYMSVLATMVCSALFADLSTSWTALGAVCFAISDGMIGIGRFVLDSQALEVPIWWVYAGSQMLITAGLFFGRRSNN